MRSHHAHCIDPGRPDLLPRAAADTSVRLGIGRTVKRDAVLVRVSTDDGLSAGARPITAAARAPSPSSSTRRFANSSSAWMRMTSSASGPRVYKMQLASHGMGAAASMALSGLDMALWDIRAKAAGGRCTDCSAARPSRSRPMPAASRSAGSSPQCWRRKRCAMSPHGYRAVKLRVGDTARDDVARVQRRARGGRRRDRHPGRRQHRLHRR